MSDQSGSSTRPTASFGRARPAVVLLALVVIWGGCSVEEHYDLLNFFFDGVPNPATMKGGAGPGQASLVYISHAPFAEEACMACHSNPAEMQLSRNDSQLCLTCHGSVPDQFEIMHGPVAAVACLWCHDPHMSPIPGLLRERSPALCVQCHSAASMLDHASDPETDGALMDCLTCHNGHGGSTVFLLREPVAAPRLKPPIQVDEGVR